MTAVRQPGFWSWLYLPMPQSGLCLHFLICKVSTGSGRIVLRPTPTPSLDSHGLVADVFQPLDPPDTWI